jgi:FkbM family methyltransferase
MSKQNDLQRQRVECFEKWQTEQGGKATHAAFDYPLNRNSVVFDIGGCLGDWADKIVELYDPILFIFEPIKEFQSKLEMRFSSKPRVKILKYGLGSHAISCEMTKLGDGSNLYGDGGDREMVEIRDVTAAALEVLEVDSLSKIHVDLASINIEGGEYDLLPRMISSGLIQGIMCLQVQFHLLWERSYGERDSIRASLAKTHRESYCYPFVWESWKKI